MKILLTELFYVCSGAVIFLGGLELAWPGSVLAYLNLNWLLLFWLVIGIVIVVFIKNKERI
ncbi:hypothetical protein K8R32_04305 [bacterium]|nr:hypothetical protein [bacterium]